MDWNFQSVKYLDDLVQNYGGRKAGVEKQISNKVIKRTSMLSDLFARQYLKVPGPTQKI